jgi:hypothetical protein
MNATNSSLPALTKLIEERLAVVGALANSLAASTDALVRNNAEAIARGASHQAELCERWNSLEAELRRGMEQRLHLSFIRTPVTGKVSTGPALADRRLPLPSSPSEPADGAISDVIAVQNSARLHAEWESLAVRIRYLTRIHSSLLLHLRRGLGILERVAGSCDATYDPGRRPESGQALLRAGE